MTTQTIRYGEGFYKPSSAISPTLKRFEVELGDNREHQVRAVPVATPSSGTATPCAVYHVSVNPAEGLRAGFDDFDNLLQEMESRPEEAQLLQQGRRWVAERFYQGNSSLAQLRLAAGMSQLELGRRAGMPQGHVSRYESGRHEPRLTTIEQMSQALGVDPQTFMQAWHATKAAADAEERQQAGYVNVAEA